MKASRFLIAKRVFLAGALIACLTKLASTLAVDLDPTLLGAWPGTKAMHAYDVAVVGNFACVAGDSLQMIDLSNPANARAISECFLGYRGERRLAVSGDHAYATAYDPPGLQVIDISVPTKPRPVGTVVTQSPLNDLAVSGHFVYLASQGQWDGNKFTNGGLKVIDISNSASPHQVGEYTSNGAAVAVALSGTYAYLAEANAGLAVIDISDPLQPRKVGALGNLPAIHQVAMTGNWACLVTRDDGKLGTLHLVDVSSPTAPRIVSVLPDVPSEGLGISGDFAYLTQGGYTDDRGEAHNGLVLVIDISIPNNPRRLGRYDAPIRSMGLTRGALGAAGRLLLAVDPGWWPLGVKGELVIFDVSSPANPRRVGSYATDWLFRNIAVSGAHAYVGAFRGLRVVDISSPTHPRPLFEQSDDYYISSLALTDGYLCVGGSWMLEDGNWGGGMRVMDLSNPALPKEVGRLVLDDWDTSTARIAASGSVAVSWRLDSGGLGLIDISDPSHPKRVGTYGVSSVSSVAISGHYAYLGVGWTENAGPIWPPPLSKWGLQVLDLSDPANPQAAGRCEISQTSQVHDIAASGEFLYVASDVGLVVVNVSIPSSPKVVSKLGIAGSRVTVSGRTLYLRMGSDGPVAMIDVLDPAKPVLVGYYQTALQSWPLAAAVPALGRYVCVIGETGFQVLDVAKAANPQRVGRYEADWSARTVALAGPLGCVVNETKHELELIDLSNPANPQRVGSYQGKGEVVGAALRGNHAYLAEWAKHEGTNHIGGGGWEVVDVSNPRNPRLVGSYELGTPGGGASAVSVSGRYAYVSATWALGTNYISGLEIFDVSNPANPQRVGSYQPSAGGLDNVVVSGSYAFGRGWWQQGTDSIYGLQILDISNPANPQRAGAYHLSAESWLGSVAVSGSYAYLLERRRHELLDQERDSLEVIDVSDPFNSRRASELELGTVSGWVVSGAYAFVVDDMAGLQVFDLSTPANPKRVGGNSLFRSGTIAVSGSTVVLAADWKTDWGLSLNSGARESLATLELQPVFKSASRQCGNLILSWEGFGPARLQRTAQTAKANWSDVPGTENANTLILPLSAGPEFFRLRRP